MPAVAITKPPQAGRKDLYDIGEVPPLGHVPARMHAWAIRKERHGPPETSMQLEVLPTWPIGDDEVLVYVMAGGVNYNGVHPAGSDRLRVPEATAQVAGEDGRQQPVRRPVHGFDRLVLAADRRDRHHRTEGLLARDLHFLGHTLQDRGLVEQVAPEP